MVRGGSVSVLTSNQLHAELFCFGAAVVGSKEPLLCGRPVFLKGEKMSDDHDSVECWKKKYIGARQSGYQEGIAEIQAEYDKLSLTLNEAVKEWNYWKNRVENLSDDYNKLLAEADALRAEVGKLGEQQAAAIWDNFRNGLK